MSTLDRRAILQIGAGSLGASLAGCLGEFSPGSDTDDGGDFTVDVFQLGGTGAVPVWYRDDGERRGAVTMVDSPRDGPWRHRFEGGDGSNRWDDFEAWLDETDFDASVVCHVETVAPNACYAEVSVDDVRVETATVESLDEERDVVAATVEAVDTSEADEGCAEVITYPAAVVRITPTDDADLPSIAQFEIVDGWGEASTEDSIRGLLAPSELPGFVQPTGDPPAVPEALSCPDDSFERLPSTGDDEVVYGETVDDDSQPLYAMRVVTPAVDSTDADADEALAFERGDDVEIVLRNVSNRLAHVGNAAKYNFEVRTTEGWQDVRGLADGDGYGYTDEGISHVPGEGVEWSFTFDEAGVVGDSMQAGELSVCPDLPAGRYRFRYWSVEGADSLAVAFDLAE